MRVTNFTLYLFLIFTREITLFPLLHVIRPDLASTRIFVGL